MENTYFQQALSAMVTNYAYGDAVRHLYDSGLSAEEIYKKIDYPVLLEKIKKVIKDYEKKKASDEFEYEYVAKQDKYGRKSFIKVKKQYGE